MKTLGWFLLRFGILFGVLAWPWPILRPVICGGFRVEVRLLVNAVLPSTSFRVETRSIPAYPSVDTLIVLTDRQNAQSGGGEASVGILFDSASQGWIPPAMAIALIIATPLPWSKRLPALLAGVLIIQLLMAVAIWVGISCAHQAGNSASLVLMLANHLLNENIWFSFVPPFLFWAAWLAWAGHWEQLGGLIAHTRSYQARE